MSFQKLLVAASISLCSFSALATHTTMPSDPVVRMGFYAEGHAGYAFQEYNNSATWNELLLPGSSDDNRHGGFSGGVDVGYQVNNNFSLEAGWFHLPSVDVNAESAADAWMESWAAYLAGKWIVPIGVNIDMFFKAGAAYRKVTLPSNTTFTPGVTINAYKSTYVRPMFAAGLQHSFRNNAFITLQYAYFMGAENSFPVTATTSGPLGTANAQVVTLSLGYALII